MAKFAANLTMLFTELPFMERFEAAQKVGFQAVEFLFPYDFEPALLAEKLHTFKLEQALFNMPPGDWEAGERGLAALPGREKEFQNSVDVALRYAEALNCKKVHAMSGVMDNKYSYELHEVTFIKNIRYAADKFAEKGVTLLIEPLNERVAPGYFISHQRDAVELIKKIGKPNVKLQFDVFHAQIMDGDITNLIHDLSDHIGHVQIASVPDRFEPNEGEIHYPYIFNVLDNVGYSGWIGCEYNPKDTTLSGIDWVKPYL
ncbi:hydroxypyruvate isomerase family protein [Vibrio sp. JC009]|uniref:2-oxo-tetronate isomerase n=1 Tax=Vibrio sp. JC009 TaxID=2912314 RepID=UPI0023B07BC2|nr:2-oxo-tetronate isomerase [Vibrio sp. JC009]WED24026.1 hydroxypyruvate isomerase family protein [Vibrio sp. JC009]